MIFMGNFRCPLVPAYALALRDALRLPQSGPILIPRVEDPPEIPVPPLAVPLLFNQWNAWWWWLVDAMDPGTTIDDLSGQVPGLDAFPSLAAYADMADDSLRTWATTWKEQAQNAWAGPWPRPHVQHPFSLALDKAGIMHHWGRRRLAHRFHLAMPLNTITLVVLPVPGEWGAVTDNGVLLASAQTANNTDAAYRFLRAGPPLPGR